MAADERDGSKGIGSEDESCGNEGYVNGNYCE